MSVDPEAVADLLRQVASEEILPRFQSLARHEVSEKEGGEIVTVADVAVERFLERRFRDLLPGSRVVGEEGAAEDPAVLDLLAGADPVWLIDPVDGTNNFAHGRPCFAVMVALVEAREIVAAWIYDLPAGRMVIAESGGGAWLDGRRMRVSRVADPAAADVRNLRGTLHAGRMASPEVARQVAARRDRLNTLRSLHCAGAEYLRLAAGETDFTLYTRMMPWDHAPGLLIHREAGGHGRTFDDRPYDPARRDTPGLLMAPDPESWRALRAVLFD